MAFLNGDNLKKVCYPFTFKFVWDRSVKTPTRKALMPIGLHELKVKKVVESKSKTGYRKVELFIQMINKPDIEIHDVNDDVQYAPIILLHCPSRNPQGKLENNWYQNFTICLSDSDLDKMLTWKGKTFKAIIGNRQRYAENRGVRKKDEFGNYILFWEAFILKTYKINETVPPFKYLPLYKPILYDPWNENKNELKNTLFAKKTEDVTGGELEKDIPF